MDYSIHTINARNNIEAINKITIESLKKKIVKYLDNGLMLLKIDVEIGRWIQTAYLRCGDQIVVLSGDESFPNKVNEIVFEQKDISWMVEQTATQGI